MVTDVATMPFFSPGLFETSLLRRRNGALPPPCLCYDKVQLLRRLRSRGGACLLLGTSLEMQGCMFRNSVLGFSKTVGVSLAVDGWVEARAGESFVFVCLP